MASDYLSILGLKLNHVSKQAPENMACWEGWTMAVHAATIQKCCNVQICNLWLFNRSIYLMVTWWLSYIYFANDQACHLAAIARTAILVPLHPCQMACDIQIVGCLCGREWWYQCIGYHYVDIYVWERPSNLITHLSNQCNSLQDWVQDAISWWHPMEIFSALLALCMGNSPVTVEFPDQRPVMQSFDMFFDLHLKQQLSKQWRRWWFEMPPCSLWRYCNILVQMS